MRMHVSILAYSRTISADDLTGCDVRFAGSVFLPKGAADCVATGVLGADAAGSTTTRRSSLLSTPGMPPIQLQPQTPSLQERYVCQQILLAVRTFYYEGHSQEYAPGFALGDDAGKDPPTNSRHSRPIPSAMLLRRLPHGSPRIFHWSRMGPGTNPSLGIMS